MTTRVFFVAAVRIAFAALLLLSLSACMLARSGDPVSIIAPDPVVVSDPDWPALDATVLVSRPEADQRRNSDRVLVRVPGSRLQAWPGTAWYDRTPDMVQTMLIRALGDSGKVRAAGRPGSLRGDYKLISELRRFEAVDDGASDLRVEIALHLSLIDHASGEVLATRLFTLDEPADGSQLNAVIVAFERGLESILPGILGWVLTQAGSQAGSDQA